MFAEIMLPHRLGLIFCSELQRAAKSRLKQASLWRHKNALLSVLQKQNLLFIQPAEAPSQGCCASFFVIVWPKAAVTTAEWLNLLTVTGSRALKRMLCCHFHAHSPSLIAFWRWFWQWTSETVDQFLVSLESRIGFLIKYMFYCS